MGYDGFISYGHAADGRLASEIQRGLARFAKPWYRRRALRVFRDETGLSTNPNLWGSIVSALDDAGWFILLASPEAAQSVWVNREIAYWLDTRGPERLLPVVTDGAWVWDAQRGDFTDDSSAVPSALRSVFSAEPRHLDLRWARAEPDLDLRDGRFRDAIANLAAPLHGVAKDDLEGEDVRQHRRTVRALRSAAAILAGLLAIAVVSATVAVAQRGRAVSERDRANQQARLADARRIATLAVSGARDDLSRSALLAIEANRLVNNAETRGALLSLVEDAAPVREIIHGSWNAAAVAPDGRTVATVSAHGISLIDLKTRHTRSISRRDFHDIRSATFSHDGRFLALAGEDVEVLNAHTGAPARPPLRFALHEGTERTLIDNVRFNPDGTSIAAIADIVVVVWSVTSGAELGRFVTASSGAGFNDVAFSPDGRWLTATGGGGVGGVVLDARSLQPRYRASPPADVSEYAVAFSPDGHRFAVAEHERRRANSAGIVFRDSATGAEVGPSISTGATILGELAFSADGRTIAGARTDGTVTEWDADSGAVRRDALPGPTRAPLSMSFTPDSALVVLTTAEIVVLDPAARLAREIAAPNNLSNINSLAVSSDGRSIAAGDGLGHVRVWDLASGKLQRTITATSPDGFGAQAITYQPGTGNIVVGGGDGTVTAWDPRSGRRIHAPIRLTEPNVVAFVLPDRGVFKVAFDARGRSLVAATGDGRVAVIDPTSWTVRRRIQLVNDAIFNNTLAISPDGQTIALAAPRVVAISDIDGTHRRHLDIGPVVATSLALQPDGLLLAAGLQDGRVLLADPTTAHLHTTLLSNHGSIYSLAFDSTNTTLAVGGLDGTVTLWALSNRQPIGPPLTSSQTRSIDALAFSPHSDSLFAGSSDGSVVRYELQSPRWIDQLCAITGRNLTADERHAYLGDPTAGRHTCPNWPAEP